MDGLTYIGYYMSMFAQESTLDENTVSLVIYQINDGTYIVEVLCNTEDEKEKNDLEITYIGNIYYYLEQNLVNKPYPHTKLVNVDCSSWYKNMCTIEEYTRILGISGILLQYKNSIVTIAHFSCF